MLSETPMRSSLQVAPLAIHKANKSLAVDHASSPPESTSSTNPYTRSDMTPPATPRGSHEDLNTDQQPSSPSSPSSPVFHNYLRAFYPFSPTYSMTDSAVTLPLSEGDVVLVHSIHTNGWADGTLLVSGARGWLPTNYCYAYDPDEMRNLLKALLNFWDLLRSACVDDNEIFANQEFMKGIIAGVRYLLVSQFAFASIRCKETTKQTTATKETIANNLCVFALDNANNQNTGADTLPHKRICRGTAARGPAKRQEVAAFGAVLFGQDG